MTACPVCSKECRNAHNLATHVNARHPGHLAPPEAAPRKPSDGPKRGPKPRGGPKPRYDTKEAAYEARKAWNAANSARISAAGRDIAPLPAVADPARRSRCAASLLEFCRTYYPAKFYLPFSPAHLSAITKAERAIRQGGLFALAMPRGSGKSEIAKRAAEWAVLNGWRKFVVLVGATDELAEGLMADIAAQFECNDLLMADYPEACHPVRRLERIQLRARAQLFEGNPTRLEWTTGQIRLAALPGSACAGAIIRTVGMTGAIRGMSAAGADGGTIRPDLCIVDDPQTRQSAHSPTQTKTRESIILGDVLGLAGPTRQVACLMPCTVIAPDDLADRMLNRELFPQWQGERTRLVDSFPADQAIWDEYFRLRDEELKADGDGSQAREFYRANRERMDAGAVLSWPERFDRDNYLSAVEEAMCYRQARPEAFAAEMQNSPALPGGGAGAALSAGWLREKTDNRERPLVPADAQLLTLGVDVQAKCLFWTVTAWNESFGGAVVDYGVYPKQNRPYWRYPDVRPSLEDRYPEMDESARIYAGLKAVVDTILSQTFERDGGGELRVEHGLIDAGWSPDVIHAFIRQSPHRTNLTASKGFGVTASHVAMSQWQRRPTRKFVGKHVVIDYLGSGRGKLTNYDSNYWKSFVANRLLTPAGGVGSLYLPGGDNGHLIDHLTAEYPVPEPRPQRGAVVDVWKLRPARDNHFWDALVLSAVAAQVRGLVFDPGAAAGDEPAPAAPPPRKLSEVYAAKKGGGTAVAARKGKVRLSDLYRQRNGLG